MILYIVTTSSCVAFPICFCQNRTVTIVSILPFISQWINLFQEFTRIRILITILVTLRCNPLYKPSDDIVFILGLVAKGIRGACDKASCITSIVGNITQCIDALNEMTGFVIVVCACPTVCIRGRLQKIILIHIAEKRSILLNRFGHITVFVILVADGGAIRVLDQRLQVAAIVIFVARYLVITILDRRQTIAGIVIIFRRVGCIAKGLLLDRGASQNVHDDLIGESLLGSIAVDAVCVIIGIGDRAEIGLGLFNYSMLTIILVTKHDFTIEADHLRHVMIIIITISDGVIVCIGKCDQIAVGISVANRADIRTADRCDVTIRIGKCQCAAGIGNRIDVISGIGDGCCLSVGIRNAGGQTDSVEQHDQPGFVSQLVTVLITIQGIGVAITNLEDSGVNRLEMEGTAGRQC